MPDFVPPNATSPVPLQQMPPPYPASFVQPEYEFDANQNEVIGGLGGSMGFVAIVSIVVGVIQGAVGAWALSVGQTSQGIIAASQAFLTILVSVWLHGASKSFKAVVATEGNDITNMMVALRKLRSVYKTYAILLGILIAIIAIAFFLGVAVAAGHHGH